MLVFSDLNWVILQTYVMVLLFVLLVVFFYHHEFLEQMLVVFQLLVPQLYLQLEDLIFASVFA